MNKEQLLQDLKSALKKKDWLSVQQIQCTLLELGDQESLDQMDSILRDARESQQQKVDININDNQLQNTSKTKMTVTEKQNKKKINILILGETGVGKSTWVNAFANYVMYGNLKEAEQGELISLIPSSFTMTDDNYQEKLITIGQDNNESFIQGQSATQDARSYNLECGNIVICLIDTLGIGDTRGI